MSLLSTDYYSYERDRLYMQEMDRMVYQDARNQKAAMSANLIMGQSFGLASPVPPTSVFNVVCSATGGTISSKKTPSTAIEILQEKTDQWLKDVKI